MASTAAPRWRRRKEARPSEIVEAALACFAEKGFAATRLDDIAARAGITRGTLYLYFTSKEELFKEVVRQAVLPILASRERQFARTDQPASEQLQRFLLSIPEALAGSPLPAIPKIIVAEAQNFPELAEFYFNEVLSRARRNLKAVLRRGVKRGEFRKIDIDHVFYCVVGPIAASVIWRNIFGRFDPDAPDIASVCRAHAELLVRGLVAPGGKQ
jgi:AcrR family transcriptional regulator